MYTTHDAKQDMKQYERFDRGESFTTAIDRIAQASYAGYKLVHGEKLEESQVKNVTGYVEDVTVGFALTTRTDRLFHINTGKVYKKTLPYIYQNLAEKNEIAVPSSHGERDYVVAINHFVTIFSFLRNLYVAIPQSSNLPEDTGVLGSITALGNWRVDPTPENIWDKIRRVQDGTLSLLEQELDQDDEMSPRLQSTLNDTSLFYQASERLIEFLYLPHVDENQSTTFGESIV